MASQDIKVNITGINEAMKILDSLDPRTQRKIIESAIQRSLTPMIKSGQSKYRSSPHPYGTTGRSAKSLTKVKLKRGVIGYRAKPKLSKGGNLVHLLDLGTKNRKTRGGANRGRIRGTRFWSSAIQQEKGNAIISAESNIVKSLEAKINRAIKKYGIKL